MFSDSELKRKFGQENLVPDCQILKIPNSEIVNLVSRIFYNFLSQKDCFKDLEFCCKKFALHDTQTGHHFNFFRLDVCPIILS